MDAHRSAVRAFPQRHHAGLARRQFGGVTGDLAGFFLQLCELGMVLCAAVGQRLEVLL